MALFTAPNCTIPDAAVEFLSAPALRGTLDIVWSCVGVLTICAWSILHPNVPSQTPIDSSSSSAKLKRALCRASRKAGLMLLTLAAPEIVAGKAFNDTTSTKVLAKQYDKFARIDKIPWSRKHTYFANMGGFGIRFSSKSLEAFQRCSPDCIMRREGGADTIFVTSLELKTTRATEVEDGEQRSVIEKHRNLWERIRRQAIDAQNRVTKSFRLRALELHAINKDRFANRMRSSSSYDRSSGYWDTWNRQLVSESSEKIGEFDLPAIWDQRRHLAAGNSWYSNLHALRTNLWILDAKQLLAARELGIINRLPTLLEDDLDDRNKGDIFAKGLAATQLIYFVLQISIRWYRGLIATQLEYTTLASALCAGYVYFFHLWKKPKDPQFTIEIPCSRYACCSNEVSWIALNGPVAPLAGRSDIWIPHTALHFDGLSYTDHAGFRNLALFYALVFGLIHCAAWNLKYPSDIELYLWRCSSLITAFAVPAGFSVYVMLLGLYTICRYQNLNLSVSRLSRPGRYLRGCSALIVFLLYVFARLFIFVEVFRSLAFLPPDAYISTWTANLPHIG